MGNRGSPDAGSREPAARREATSAGKVRPKRGAFPTPKSEIAKATPFIPDDNGEHDRPQPPADVEE